MNSAGQSSPIDFNRILDGMLRAARLDAGFYETAEHDVSYTQDSLVVVILVSILGGIGSFLASLLAGHFGAAVAQLFVQSILGVVFFYAWTFLVHWIGTSLFHGTGDFGEVQRCLGFAYAPQVLNVLRFIPCLGGLIGFVAWIWTIATGFVAVKQSLDLDNTNAALTIVIAAAVVIVISIVIGIILAAIGLAGAAVTGALQ